jgi:sulfite reductase (NADPH) hemoprotein beta-component
MLPACTVHRLRPRLCSSARAAQFRDQLERNLAAGELSDDHFRPLRLQNGWYVQRHAPMLRVAVPYGELSARQLRMLARIAREYDHRDAGLPTERGGFGHFTTRQNLQFNWIPLDRAADVMDLLAEVDMHGIQTSGNCIRNVTTDAFAGIAPDEVVDPRPYCEILRQWSTLHPEFAFLPRKFKIAVTGAREDRAAIAWHDIGLQLRRRRPGRVGFRVLAGGGMGRTPVIGTEVQRLRALAADPGLHRGHRARLQPARPARQRLQGAHQDPGQGRGPALRDDVRRVCAAAGRRRTRRSRRPN